MGRRGENIRKRKDGRWEARVVRGKPVDGKTDYKYLYGKTYQDVRRKKISYLADCQPGQSETHPLPEQESAARAPLFRDIAAQWLASKKSVVRESTWACYTIMVGKHIVPELGEVPVSKGSRNRLEEFLIKKKQNGRLGGGALSDKTISDMKVILMQILRFAKNENLISSLPECPPVSCRQPAVSVFTQAEQKRIEEKALEEDNPFSLGVLLSLYGGLRIGEVCGLQWKDFDWQNGTLTVSRTVYRVAAADDRAGAKTKVVIGTPKTDCSIRTIPLPVSVFRYFLQCRRDGESYVVTGTARYMEPRVCLDRYKRFLRRADVAGHTFHALRHTFATGCVEHGVDVKSLSEIMGHSDVRITLQRYVHPSMEAKKAQINKLPCFHSGQISGQNIRRLPDFPTLLRSGS
ncbi:MAG: site-specific integrase [Lachnospiraceae bacterium]|nr:site-specific integrase [Lachnospiraceae bacterium]